MPNSAPVLSSLLNNIDLDANDALHPFTDQSLDTQALSLLLERVSQVSRTLSTYASNPTLLNPDDRLTSLLKEHSSHSQVLTTLRTEDDVRIERLGALKRPQLYGEDAPFTRTQLPEYILSRIEACTTSAGLDVYRDQESTTTTTFACGGKVLVLDIILTQPVAPHPSTPSETTDGKATEEPLISLTSLKLSHATDDASSNIRPSDLWLNELLAASLRLFITEAHRQEPLADSIKISLALKDYQTHLETLMKMDTLAAEGGEGAKWLHEPSVTAELSTDITKEESHVIKRATADMSQTPLDILLKRGHGLPLPYLNNPSLSFLVDISPRSYLTIQRHALPQASIEESVCDLDLFNVRSFLSAYIKHAKTSSPSFIPFGTTPNAIREHLFTTATLSLHQDTPRHFSPAIPSTFSSLAQRASPLYPLILPSTTTSGGDPPPSIAATLSHCLPEKDSLTWMLDFSRTTLDHSRTTVHSNVASHSSSPFNGCVKEELWLPQSAMREIWRAIHGQGANASGGQMTSNAPLPLPAAIPETSQPPDHPVADPTLGSAPPLLDATDLETIGIDTALQTTSAPANPTPSDPILQPNPIPMSNPNPLEQTASTSDLDLLSMMDVSMNSLSSNVNIHDPLNLGLDMDLSMASLPISSMSSMPSIAINDLDMSMDIDGLAPSMMSLPTTDDPNAHTHLASLDSGLSMLGMGLDLDMDMDMDMSSIGMGFGMNGMTGMSVHPRWFDKLVNPQTTVFSPQYSSSSASPMKPSVHTTLLTPREVGFSLSRVPVKSLSQIHAVLEIVRDYVWLNEFLRSAPWTGEGLGTASPAKDSGDDDGDLDLEALLNGLHIPASIPATTSIRLHPHTHTKMTAKHASRVSVNFVFPLPLPSSPLCSMTLSPDVLSTRGIRVRIRRAKGIGERDVQLDGKTQKESEWDWVKDVESAAEEYLRRGGGMGIVAWVWERVKTKNKLL